MLICGWWKGSSYIPYWVTLLNRISENYKLTRSELLTLQGVKINWYNLPYCLHYVLKKKSYNQNLSLFYSLWNFLAHVASSNGKGKLQLLLGSKDNSVCRISTSYFTNWTWKIMGVGNILIIGNRGGGIFDLNGI